MRGKLLVMCIFVVTGIAIWYGCTKDSPVLPPQDRPPVVEGDEGAALYEWALGPIEGVTTVWHPAPAELTVPVGTTIRLKCAEPNATSVNWVNASPVKRIDGGSIAELRVDTPGRHEVAVTAAANLDDGGGSKRRPGSASETVLHSCVINAVPGSINDITVAELVPEASPLTVTESSSNDETMYAFFSGGVRFQVVSQLVALGPGHYASAVGRQLTIRATASDPRFQSLVEIRTPGARPTLDGPIALLSQVGGAIVSAGPTIGARQLAIDTYSTNVTSDWPENARIPENQAITFRATTQPSGYEKYVTWISSTKYGTATPIVGHGASFTTTFNNTWGPHPDDPELVFQWLGVRADNAVFNQDVKCEVQIPYDGNDHVVHTFSPPDSSVMVLSSATNPSSVLVVLKDASNNDILTVTLAPGDGVTLTDGSAATACVRTAVLAGQAACLAVNQATWEVASAKSATEDGIKSFAYTNGKGQWTYHVKNLGTCPMKVQHYVNDALKDESLAFGTNEAIDFTANQNLITEKGRIRIFCAKAADKTCKAEVTRVSVP